MLALCERDRCRVALAQSQYMQIIQLSARPFGKDKCRAIIFLKNLLKYISLNGKI